jgi:hypothetical protein
MMRKHRINPPAALPLSTGLSALACAQSPAPQTQTAADSPAASPSVSPTPSHTAPPKRPNCPEQVTAPVPAGLSPVELVHSLNRVQLRNLQDGLATAAGCAFRDETQFLRPGGPRPS